MINNARFKITVISIFSVLLFLPTINDGIPVIQVQVVNENRNKARKPGGFILGEIYDNQNNYTQNMERYYNDNFGLRDFLIRLKNQFDYSFFKESDELYIGIDNYMAYKSVITFEQIMNESMTDSDVQSDYNRILNLRKILDEKNIEFFILICPQKNSVFPEWFPNNPVRRPEQTSYDRLITFLAENEEMKGRSLDTKKALLEAAEIAPVYPRSDFHWNEWGSANTAKAMMELINSKLGKNVLWGHELVLKETPDFSGVLNNSLSVFNNPTETNYGIEQNFTRLSYIRDGWELHKVNKGTKDLLPPCVLIGTSYSGYYFDHSGFFNHFEEAYMFRLDWNNYFNNFLLPKNTKIVVLEIVESHIFNISYWIDGLANAIERN